MHRNFSMVAAEEAKRLVINEGVTSMADFYAELKRLLELADWFGNNLDAFNDALRGGCGTVDPEGKVFVWKGHAAAKAELGQPNWDNIHEIFNDKEFVVELQ